MAYLFEKKDRHVIPNWRSFENTAKLGELNGSRGIKLTSNFKPDISDLLEDWTDLDNHTMGVAGDLLGVALVSNQQSDPKVIEIAKYIVQNETIAPKALINAAESVLMPSNNKTLKLDIESVEEFQGPTSQIILHKKINDLKRKLIENPSNSINWMEIGRLYAVVGQTNKAERSIKNALFLAPENRFILRNMTRFFVHLGNEGVSFAHDLVRKSNLVKYDPWLLSTEISLATLRGRNSRFMKQGLQIIDSNSYHPFNITELASSLATVEMKNGNNKKSKKLFEQSLKHPNDNSLAQAEWASQENHTLFSINSSQMDLANSYEAKARDFSEKEEWGKAVEYSKKWFLDLPFSKGAVLFGNNIALKKLKDHDTAVEIGKLGLVSHPHDPHLLNNIIYSLCLQNKIEEAEILIQKINRVDLISNNRHNICLLATLGLFNYRKGYPEKARKLYLDSIKLAKQTENNNLASVALVNMTREEISLGEEDMSNVINTLIDISRKTDDMDLKEDIKSVVEMYNKRL